MKLLILLSLLFLTACGEPKTYCEKEFEPIVCNQKNDMDVAIFEMCLDKMAKARSTQGSYTTHDDEDLDSAIKACRQSSYTTRFYVDFCEPNPRYLAQKKYCVN